MPAAIRDPFSNLTHPAAVVVRLLEAVLRKAAMPGLNTIAVSAWKDAVLIHPKEGVSKQHTIFISPNLFKYN